MGYAQKFDKDWLYTKIDQHRFWQNTKTWGPFLLPVPYKSWSTFYAVNLFLMMRRQMNWNCNQAMIMTKLIINVGGDSGGGGGGAELVDGGMSPWAGYCQCFSYSPRPWSRPSSLPSPPSHPLTRRRGRCLAHLPQLLLLTSLVRGEVTIDDLSRRHDRRNWHWQPKIEKALADAEWSQRHST